MKIAEGCRGGLEYVNFTATCWEAVICIVSSTGNIKQLQVFHAVLSCSCSDTVSRLDGKLTGLHILKDVFFMLDKTPYIVFRFNTMFAHYFEFLFFTDSPSLAASLLVIFVCIFLAFFDTCRSYKMLLMNQNNPLCRFSLLMLCGKPNV